MAKLGKTISSATKKAEAKAAEVKAAAQKATALLMDPTREAARHAFDMILASRARLAAKLD